MRQVMSGEATPSQLAGFLVALRAKGETVDEIVGFRDAILEHALPLPVDPMALDIVGTGGDRFGTVNVSTMAAIVAAGSRRPGGQARQPGGELGVGLVRRARRARRRPDALARARRARCSTSAGSPSRSPRAFHPGFRARRPDPRASSASRPCSTSSARCATRRAPRRNAVGVAHARPRAAHRRRVPDPRRDRARLPRRRRARRAHDHRPQPRLGGLAAATSTSTTSTRATSASRARHRRPARAATPRTTPRSCGACWRGEDGPGARHRAAQRRRGLVAYRLFQDAAQVQRPILERLAEARDVAAEAIDSAGSEHDPGLLGRRHASARLLTPRRSLGALRGIAAALALRVRPLARRSP